ncbi:hypothetical protein CCACVL1_26588 [Corchorus capsularis]|uniref:Uncharacterized protein n=1 Tax=Corchorus capsularis TaxID=210143 RepID=A0A1R3GE76_COCAP|nr:hypothetical protein CCACVL1_26588 [Corchorus capsularis]
MARFPSKGYRKTRANPRAGARQAACSKRRSDVNDNKAANLNVNVYVYVNALFVQLPTR